MWALLSSDERTSLPADALVHSFGDIGVQPDDRVRSDGDLLGEGSLSHPLLDGGATDADAIYEIWRKWGLAFVPDGMREEGRALKTEPFFKDSSAWIDFCSSCHCSRLNVSPLHSDLIGLGVSIQLAVLQENKTNQGLNRIRG